MGARGPGDHSGDPLEFDEFAIKHALWDSATVDARLRSTFAEEDVPTASVLLAALVGDVPEAEADVSDLATCRLMLAAIRVSDGELARLAMWVETARRDPRDLMAAAEYPRELQGGGPDAREADFAEYVAWARGSLA